MPRKTLFIVIGFLGLLGTAFFSFLFFHDFAVSEIPGWSEPILSPYQSIIILGLIVLTITFLLIFFYGILSSKTT